MRCVGISDLHGALPDIPECDVVLCAGDISPLEIQYDYGMMVQWFRNDFMGWVDSLPCSKFILVAGNHDFFLEEIHEMGGDWLGPDDVMGTLIPGYDGSSKLVYLCDSSYEYDGKVFYGTPYVEVLKRWAFYMCRKDIAGKFGDIPDCDVVVTHMPPVTGGMGKVMQEGVYNEGVDYGSAILAGVLKERSFRYALCGHVHSGMHEPVDIGGKSLVNVSLKDERYHMAYDPFVFDL